MIFKNSRYSKAGAFAKNQGDVPQFRGIRPREIAPATGVIEHIIEEGQRLDLLARHYYNDSRLWWRILDANPDLFFGGNVHLDAMAGQVILIPKARE